MRPIVFAGVAIVASTALTGCFEFEHQQAACALASTWTVADEFRYEGDTEATAMAVDGHGNVYAAGAATVGKRSTWIVRASGDQGLHWAYSDASNSSFGDARPAAMLWTQAGLFVTGEMRMNAVDGWITRFGNDSGWANDDVSNHFTGTSGLKAIASDGGNVLTTGYGGGDGSRWILRTKDATTGFWTGVAVDGNADATVTVVDKGRSAAVAATGGDWIVAGGDRIRTTTGALRGRWVVRRSIDRGLSWTDVDTATGGLRTEARAATTASDGTVYVAGTLEDANGKVHWLVRRSTNFGASWESVDDYVVDVGAAQPNGILVGGDGLVWVAGITGSLDGDRWTVRRGGGKGAAWSTVETFLATGHSGAAANALAIGADGAVYAAGRTTVIGQGTRWLVRKLPCLPAPTP